MIVYRFERKGIGPYVSGTRPSNGSFYRKKSTTRTEKKYANRFNETIKSMKVEDRIQNWERAHGDKQYMYGCTSKEALRIYFGGNFKRFFAQGFRIKRYKVPQKDVIDMGIEVAFPVKFHKLQTVKKLKKQAGFA